jgi:formylglycine-generating enzyme required for sulfatase activity
VPMVLVPEGTFQMGLEADTAYQECQQLYIGGTCDLIFFTNMEPVLQVYLDTF